MERRLSTSSVGGSSAVTIQVGSRVIAGAAGSASPSGSGSNTGTRRLMGGKTGVVRFIGVTNFATGEWVGVELDEPEGKNDGSVGDTKYFDCPPNHGIFVKRAQVRIDREDIRGYTPGGTKEKLEELRAARRMSASATSDRDSSKSPARSGRTSPTGDAAGGKIWGDEEDELVGVEERPSSTWAGPDLDRTVQTMGIIRHLRVDLLAAQNALAEAKKAHQEEVATLKTYIPAAGGSRPLPGGITAKAANEAMIASLSKEVEELRNFKERAQMQVSGLKQSVDSDGSSRKMVESLTEQNLELKKKVRKLEGTLAEGETAREVLMGLEESHRREVSGTRSLLDQTEARLMLAQEENARLERTLLIEKGNLDRYKAMVEQFQDQSDTQTALGISEKQGYSSLELARIKRAYDTSVAQSRTVALQLELEKVLSCEYKAQLERYETMSGDALGGIYELELHWLSNDQMMMEGISKAAIASRSLLVSLPSVEGVSDEHKMYAAVLRGSVHVDVCVDLLKGLCLALLAAGKILYATPSESNDFVPIISAVRECGILVCSKLEAEGELSAREDVQSLVSLTSLAKYQYLEKSVGKGSFEPYTEADSFFVWELLIQLAYYIGGIESIATGSRFFYRLAEVDPNVGSESKPFLTAGLAVIDAIVHSSIHISEEYSAGEGTNKSGLVGDAAWRTNGISSAALVGCRNDALTALHKLSTEFSYIDREIDARSKPLSLSGKERPEAVLDTVSLAKYNKALESAHSELSKIVAYTKKVGIKLPPITSPRFCWGLLSQGISFEMADSGNAVKSFAAMPCNWRARTEKLKARLEAVLSKESLLSELQVSASQSSSQVERSSEELAAALNRVAELDNLLSAYIEKNKALEETVFAGSSAVAKLTIMENDNKSLKNRLEYAEKHQAVPTKGPNDRRLSLPASTVPVSAVALEAALEVTRAWRSVARHNALASLLPIYQRPPCIEPISDVDSPTAIAFNTARELRQMKASASIISLKACRGSATYEIERRGAERTAKLEALQAILLEAMNSAEKTRLARLVSSPTLQ